MFYLIFLTFSLHNFLRIVILSFYCYLLEINLIINPSSQQMAGNGNQLTSSQIGAANALTGSQLLQASANAPLTKQDLFTLKSRRNCDYFNVCRKFKNSLGLPNYYFDKVLYFYIFH